MAILAVKRSENHDHPDDCPCLALSHLVKNGRASGQKHQIIDKPADRAHTALPARAEMHDQPELQALTAAVERLERSAPKMFLSEQTPPPEAFGDYHAAVAVAQLPDSSAAPPVVVVPREAKTQRESGVSAGSKQEALPESISPESECAQPVAAFIDRLNSTVDSSDFAFEFDSAELDEIRREFSQMLSQQQPAAATVPLTPHRQASEGRRMVEHNFVARRRCPGNASRSKIFQQALGSNDDWTRDRFSRLSGSKPNQQRLFGAVPNALMTAIVCCTFAFAVTWMLVLSCSGVSMNRDACVPAPPRLIEVEPPQLADSRNYGDIQQVSYNPTPTVTVQMYRQPVRQVVSPLPGMPLPADSTWQNGYRQPPDLSMMMQQP